MSPERMTLMFRHTLRLFVFLVVFASVPLAHAQSGSKLGVVDFQRALNEVSEGKKAKANLEERYEATRLQVESRRAEVQQMQENLEAQRVMLSATALTEKEQALQTKMVEFQQLVMESQQEMGLMEQELTAGILEKLYKVAQGIGAEGGFNLVVESSAVVFVNGVTDITDQVIAKFNSK